MNIYLVNGKPCISVMNGFYPIDEQTYYLMLEEGIQPKLEVIEHD